MIPLRTELQIPPSSLRITYGSRIFTTGSCFSDELGRWLSDNKFHCSVNPFGTTYNPVSIHRAMTDALRQTPVDEKKIVTSNDLHYHFDFHSRWASADATTLKQQLQSLHQDAATRLNTSDVIIITYGTAWVYEHVTLNDIVANCHKMPAQQFRRRLLAVNEIIRSFEELYATVAKNRPSMRFVLTVSPVRHTRDTLPLNAVSKSALLLACHEISGTFQGVEYFPSYEIMVDDLRDYRFYGSDLIHPNELAIQYIAEKFEDRYFNEETRKLVATWQSLRKALLHRPFKPDADQHRKFLQTTLQALEDLNKRMDVGTEIENLKHRMTSHDSPN